MIIKMVLLYHIKHLVECKQPTGLSYINYIYLNTVQSFTILSHILILHYQNIQSTQPICYNQIML
jgi:hypothetical protein